MNVTNLVHLFLAGTVPPLKGRLCNEKTMHYFSNIPCRINMIQKYSVFIYYICINYLLNNV